MKCLHDEQRREAVIALVLPGAPTTCHRKSGHTTGLPDDVRSARPV